MEYGGEAVRRRQVASNDEVFTLYSEAGEKRRGGAGGWRWWAVAVVSAAVVLAVVGHARSPIDPVEREWSVVKVEMSGVFEVNQRLSKGSRVELAGPDSVVEDGRRNLYMGLRNGRVVKLHPGQHNSRVGEGRVETISYGKFPGAEKTDAAAPHGRPLGVRIRNNTLYVADAVHGMYSIELSSRRFQFIIKPSDSHPPLRNVDDFDISADGKTVFLVESSSKFSVLTPYYDVIEGRCTGRLLTYDLQARVLATVREGLCHPSGVELGGHAGELVIAEKHARRVSWLDAGTGKTRRVLHLPTEPNNVRANVRGNYWVASETVDDDVTTWHEQYPHVVSRVVAGLLPHRFLRPTSDRGSHSVLVEVDQQGKVVRTLHDPRRNLVTGLTHATQVSDGRLALCSSDHVAFVMIDDDDDDY